MSRSSGTEGREGGRREGAQVEQEGGLDAGGDEGRAEHGGQDDEDRDGEDGGAGRRHGCCGQWGGRRWRW